MNVHVFPFSPPKLVDDFLPLFGAYEAASVYDSSHSWKADRPTKRKKKSEFTAGNFAEYEYHVTDQCSM